jgi:hypothetical protein
MKTYRVVFGLICTFCPLAIGARMLHSQEKAAPSTVQVHMVITDQAFSDNSEIPVLRPDTVQVKQGKNLLKVNQLIPAQGDNAALQLFILIDDTCDPVIGNNLNDLKDFINAQPASTLIGVAYMSNATIQITQNFTADHALAAKAVRLPRGNLSAMDSPYLSLISLVKGWPEQKVRREVLMITDGVDRLRGERSSSSQIPPIPPRTPAGAVPTRGVNTMPIISPDADTASRNSQRYGVIVHSIYAPGAGRLGRNAWEAQLGQSGVAKIADETGGEYFALGTQNAVSFKPYLDRLQKIFDNQYYLVFQAVPGKKDGLQRVNVSTQVSNADLAAADNVWVASANEAAGSKKD